MSTPFQNRLVGTIIVAAAVVIFLPDILDGEKESYQADFEAIPNAPAFEGSIEHKKFPTETLDRIAEPELSDEVALDEESDSSEPAVVNQDNAANEAVTRVNKIEKEVPIEAIKPEDKPQPVLPEVKKDKYAWVIHLGSFKHKKNVDELMRKLKDNGYTAFTQPIKTKKGTLTKVIVGPSLNKADLNNKLDKLKALTKVQGRIARFKVTK